MNDPRMQREMEMAPVNIKDLKMMYIAKIGANEGRIAAEVKEANNALVEEWYDTMLVKLCNDKREITCKEAGEYWEIFKEGKRLAKYKNFEHLMHHYDIEIVKKWREFFEQDIKTIHAYSHRVALIGWAYIQGYYNHCIATELIEKMYTSENPVDWAAEGKKIANQRLLKGMNGPFDISVIEQKVNLLLTIQPTPSN